MLLSLAMIVRDAETTLGRCLDSVAGVVDEVVVVDTGSVDATRDMAAAHDTQLHQLPWPGDFAAARNHAFALAQGEWLLWLDADDRLVNGPGLRTLLEHAPPETAGVYLRYVNGRDAWGNCLCEFWRERCVRRDAGFRWQGRVHEVLVGKGPLLQSAAAWVEHCPDPAAAARKGRRNLDLLETGAGSNPRRLFYLGCEYADAGDYPRAAEHLRACLAASHWADERYLAALRLAAVLRGGEDYPRALEADLAAVGIHPNWPQGYFGLAETCYLRRQWSRVLHWCDLGRALPPPVTLHFTAPLAQQFGWIIHYTNALYHLGRVAEALTWTRHALSLVPDDPWHRENFLFFARCLDGAGRVAEPAGECP